MNILNAPQKYSLGYLLEKLKKFDLSNVSDIGDIAIQTIKYLHSNDQGREKLRVWQYLENKWYSSLKNGEPDYSVYDPDFYLAELFACWSVYSRKYLLEIQKEKSLPPLGVAGNLQPRTILDLGCGFGYTCWGLKQVFPFADVIGTNIENTLQIKVARDIGNEQGFCIQPFDALSGHIGLVFASEYFEHIDAPIEHLQQIIDRLSPDAFLIANSFNTIAIGHFLQYRVGNSIVDQSKISKLFNDKLRENGYSKIKTKLWNNRPAFWKKL